MPIANVNNVGLYYELSGSGDVPVVMVHGSWAAHNDWNASAPLLAQSFRVLTYDRRGHSQSERPDGPGSVQEDVADLAALIETLELAPAWVVGNSFGASIALRLAGERPDLLRGLIVHEPPLFSLIMDDPEHSPIFEEVRRRILSVAERIAGGDHAGATVQFVETVALGPGSWEKMPESGRRTLIENAPTFLDEARDPGQLVFALDSIRSFPAPVLFTLGEESPPAFAPVVGRLAEALPRAEVRTIRDAGHIPHITRPDAYCQLILDFIAQNPR